MGRLKEKYEKEIKKKLAEEFGIKNALALPRLIKIVVNMGVGDALRNKEILEQMKRDLSLITGQVPSVRPAKVSVASFGVRRGMPVGLKVTLRKERMYSFFDKLVSIVLPRLRDFRGLPKSGFDQKGNYTIGLAEHTVFPEVDVAKSSPHGLEVTIITNAKNPKQSKRLLELMGMPFEKE